MRQTTIAALALLSIDTNWTSSVINDADVPVPDGPEAQLKLAAKLSNLGSQRTVAAFCINATEGRVTGPVLNGILNDECDGKGSERVGAHYLSLARTGKLAGIRSDISIASKSRTAKPYDSLEAANNALNRVIGRVPVDQREAFVTHARAALKAMPKNEVVEPAPEA